MADDRRTPDQAAARERELDQRVRAVEETRQQLEDVTTELERLRKRERELEDELSKHERASRDATVCVVCEPEVLKAGWVPLAWRADKIGRYFWSERQVILVLVPLYVLAAAGAFFGGIDDGGLRGIRQCGEA